MSSSIDSLSGLADRVQGLLTYYGREDWSAAQFGNIKLVLNELQASCPNHKGILGARVVWYERGLANFEKLVVEPIEKGAEYGFLYSSWPFPSSSDAPALYANTELLSHFMRRSYLKNDFSRLYKQLLHLYSRIAAVAGGRKSEEIKRAFAKEIAWFEDALLEGKL